MSTEAAVNPHSRTPSGQGSNIPLGWKPTALEPVPVVRCIQIKKNGEQCNRWSLRGSTSMKCYKHLGNGNLRNVKEHSQAVIEAERLRIVDSVSDAVDWILDLGANATSEAVRLKAATEVLDRAGIRGGTELDIGVSLSDDPASLLRERISSLKKRVVDAECVTVSEERQLEERSDGEPEAGPLGP